MHIIQRKKNNEKVRHKGKMLRGKKLKRQIESDNSGINEE